MLLVFFINWKITKASCNETVLMPLVGVVMDTFVPFLFWWMHMLCACLGHRGHCSEPIMIEVFALHKRPGGEAGKDERELGQMG